MSVTPTNPSLESIPASGISPFDTDPQIPPGDDGRRSALEALLAFAALHQQMLSRSYRDDNLTKEDSWHLEQFVLDEVLQLVAERAQAITGADGIAIALAEHNAIVCRASTGKIAPDHGVGVDPNSGFSGACLSSGEIVRCDDTETDPRVDAYACRRLGARAMVAVPLCAQRTVIGLVEAFASEPFGFNDSDVRSLSLLSELILAALRPEEEQRFAEASRQIVGPAEDLPDPPELPAAQNPGQNEGKTDTAARSDESVSLAQDQDAVLAKTRPGLGVVFAVVLCALILGAGLWWKMRTSQSKVAVQTAVQPAAQPTLPATPVAAQPAANDPELSEEEAPVTPANPTQLSKLPEVTGIRHWSSPNSSSVVIDLQDQVQYEAHRLTNPERIYFDLHETRLGSDLFGKSFEVEDPLIQRVRVAQPVPGITRIVLETKGASNFSVSLEINPYRLVVEVRKIGSKPEAMTKFDQFVPIEQASIAASPVHAVSPKLRIVLDAGHGGWDLGTVGRQGLLEKDLALDIVSRLGKLVERRLGAEVIYTRKDDNYLPLEERTEIANVSQADLFVSVHANYSDYASARGVETYYTNTYSSVKARLPGGENTGPVLQDIDWTKVDIREKVRDSHRLAVSVQHALYNTLVQKNPGLPNRGVKEAQYVVLTGTAMPAILAEISFVSSPTDENNLQNSSYRQQVAEALCEGLEQYTKKSETIKLASASQ